MFSSQFIRQKCSSRAQLKRQLFITPAAHNQEYTTLPFISAALKTSAKNRLLNEGKHFHGHMIKFGFANVLSLGNQLLHVYVKCNEFFDACKLFDEMRVRNVVTWNTLICGLADSSGTLILKFHFGFNYFKRMMMEWVPPDRITYSGLFRICGEVTGGIEGGRELHCLVVKLGFCKDCFVNTALIDFYGKFDLVGDARRVFEGATVRDLVLWNVMVSCYVSNGLGEETFQIYSLMLLNGFKADVFTFASLLNCCAKLGYHELGRQIHGLGFKLCFGTDVVVGSAVIDMYVKNENTFDARKAFGGLASKNVVSWTTMILGYGGNGDGKEAIKLLKEMFREDFRPDELTLAGVLSSCGNLSMESEVVQVHANAIKLALSSSLSIANSLINAYSKCGCITSALKCFNSIEIPDLISWTSMIGAYAFHGFADEAIKFFDNMLASGLKPDKIAFLEILSACSHGGLVSEGLKYFASITDYDILLTPEHYTCLIDLLGRVGLLNDANIVLKSIPLESQPHALKAFIGASEIHGNIELARWAAKKLCLMEPNNALNYVLLSKSYASDRKWSDSAVVRELMKEKLNSKIPGISWTEITQLSSPRSMKL